jgi:hypothetical protein
VSAARRVITAFALVGVLGLSAARTAIAHDSLAPAGAAHNWLPGEEWVYRHWIPFDEQVLKLALGLQGRELEAYLYNDHHTLAELAVARGVHPEQLADYLVAPWRPIADHAHVTMLRDRTMRLLTQGHLAQHVFFHVFHGLDASAGARKAFGISPERYLKLRSARASPLDIARKGEMPVSGIRQMMIELFRTDYQRGIDSGQTWAAESELIMTRQLARLPCWTRSPPARWDPGNPYGKQMQQHGDHPSDWPRTPAERREDHRRVDRSRRSLPRSCWRRPPPSPTATNARLAGHPRTPSLLCRLR